MMILRKLSKIEEALSELFQKEDAAELRADHLEDSRTVQEVCATAAAGNIGGPFKSKVLILRPQLEKQVGRSAAVVLNQLAYLLQNPNCGTVLSDGRRYIFNTYPQWQASYFPAWSIPTIKRAFRKLESKGLVEAKQPEETDRGVNTTRFRPKGSN